RHAYSKNRTFTHGVLSCTPIYAPPLHLQVAAMARRPLPLCQEVDHAARMARAVAPRSHMRRPHRYRHPLSCAAVGQARRGESADDVPEGVLYACPGYVPGERGGHGLCPRDRTADDAEKYLHRCAG